MKERWSLNVEWRDFMPCSPVEVVQTAPGRIASLRKASQVLQNVVTYTVARESGGHPAPPQYLFCRWSRSVSRWCPAIGNEYRPLWRPEPPGNRPKGQSIPDPETDLLHELAKVRILELSDREDLSREEGKVRAKLRSRFNGGCREDIGGATAAAVSGQAAFHLAKATGEGGGQGI